MNESPAAGLSVMMNSPDMAGVGGNLGSGLDILSVFLDACPSVPVWMLYDGSTGGVERYTRKKRQGKEERNQQPWT